MLNKWSPIEQAAEIRSRFRADAAKELCILYFELFDFGFLETVKMVSEKPERIEIERFNQRTNPCSNQLLQTLLFAQGISTKGPRPTNTEESADLCS
jgi:hypothetical protein